MPTALIYSCAGAFAGVLSTPYEWVAINILVTLTVGVLLGIASAKIAAAITPKEKAAVQEKTAVREKPAV